MYIKSILERPAIQQFIKYVIVGTVVTLIDMAALHLFYHGMSISIKISVVLGFLCGNVSSFVLNKYFTFRNYSSSIIRQYSKYFVTSMTGLAWTVFLMSLFYEKLGMFAGISQYNYLLCKMLVAILVMFWNFLIIRNWTLANYELGQLQSFAVCGKLHSVYLSIIIPAYNEEKRLPGTLDDVLKWLNEETFSWEIIVVDDGSKDNMVNVIRQQFTVISNLKVLSLGSNCGKGAAVKAGMLIAKGEYRLFMDADHQINVNELNNFLPLANEHEILIGSKYKSAKQNNSNSTTISFTRKLVSRIGNLLIRMILNLSYKDTQCGFKLFPAEIADNIFRLQSLNGFSFDIELLVLASLFHVSVTELPVEIRNVSESHVRTVRDSLGVLIDLLQIKVNIWKRKYSQEFSAMIKQNERIKSSN